jgi:hypothetical protein
MPPFTVALALNTSEPATSELPPPAAPTEEARPAHHEGRLLAAGSGFATLGSAVLFSVAGVSASRMDDAESAEDLQVVQRRTNAWAGAGGGALVVAGTLGVAAVVRW